MTNHHFDDPERSQRWLALWQSLNPEIDPAAMQLMDRMRMVGIALRRVGEESLAAADLSYAQYRVLMSLFIAESIDNQPQLNPSEISERQGTSRNTISSLIRSLEQQGLVERQLDPSDRRRFNIRLTAAGRALIQEHTRLHTARIAQCFAALTPDEQQQLSELLLRLGRHLSHVKGHTSARKAAPDSAA